jgi:hypothetical protein
MLQLNFTCLLFVALTEDIQCVVKIQLNEQPFCHSTETLYGLYNVPYCATRHFYVVI